MEIYYLGFAVFLIVLLLWKTWSLQSRLNDREKEVVRLETSLEQLTEGREAMKKEFELLAGQILDAKGATFHNQSSEKLQAMLEPLKQDVKSFRDRLEVIHKDDITNNSALKTELTNLQKLNQAITEQTENLTKALRTEKKKQGNWGELILENVLDSSGLRAGLDYTTQKSFQDEDGQKRLPDAIINLPHGKTIIIDAKTSLNAYTDYVNAENDESRNNYLKQHYSAISDRIAELSAKNYYNLKGLNSPEVVIMFIPVESAYVEALRYNGELFQQAIESNILVATPSTLLTSLKIVRQLWRFEEQNKHTAEIANRAERFYKKLNTFLNSMQQVKNQLDKAQDSYEKAMSQLYTGKANLIKQASEFKELGVSVQKELPADLVEKANLELE